MFCQVSKCPSVTVQSNYPRAPRDGLKNRGVAGRGTWTRYLGNCARHDHDGGTSMSNRRSGFTARHRTCAYQDTQLCSACCSAVTLKLNSTLFRRRLTGAGFGGMRPTGLYGGEPLYENSTRTTSCSRLGIATTPESVVLWYIEAWVQKWDQELVNGKHNTRLAEEEVDEHGLGGTLGGDQDPHFQAQLRRYHEWTRDPPSGGFTCQRKH